MSERDDPSLLAAGYALGILTPEEKAVYEAFLATSAQERAEAEANDEAASTLGFNVEPVQPPPELKDRLMAQVAETPQLPAHNAISQPNVSGAKETVPSAPPVRHRAEPTAAAETKARARWFRPVMVAAAAAAAIILFAGGTLLGVNLNGSQPSQQPQSVLAEITSASDAQRATAPVSGGGTATLVWSTQLGKSAILIRGLNNLPADKTYELWYIRDNAATPAGTMDSSGTTTWRVLTGTVTSGDVIGLTVEPEGGSKKPTTKPLITIPT